MKSLINNYMLFQTNLDSSSLTVNGMIVHRFQETGDFQIQINRKNYADRIIRLKVSEESKEIQLNVDLATILINNNENCSCDNNIYKTQDHVYDISSNANVVFYISKGSGGYYVIVTKIDKERKKIFDSRELNEGDIFVANILRPGKYSMINTLTKARGQIAVSYPPPNKTKYIPPQATSIKCNEKFNPNSISIQPAQGIIFYVVRNSRIKIDLMGPDDGKRQRGNKNKWTKLQSKK